MKHIEEDPSGRFIRYDVLLGQGSYKLVYKAFDTHEAVEVAWNKLQVDRIPEDQIQKVRGEVELLRRLNHNNIIKLYDAWCSQSKGKANMDFITELMSSGTLKEYLTRSRVMKLKVIRRWCYNLLDAIAYLHEQNPPVMHRDLKCDNIFINGHVGEVKIGDLGLSGVKQDNFAHSVIGTPEFMAPELYEEAYTEKVDIYAFGMCMLEMLTMEYPYSECENPAQIFRKVFAGERPMSFQRLPHCEVKQIISSCLEREKRRPTARQLMNHPFFKDWASDDGIATNLSVSTNKIRLNTLSKGIQCKTETQGDKNQIQNNVGGVVEATEQLPMSSYANLQVGQSAVFNSNMMKRDVFLACERLVDEINDPEICVTSANDGSELRIAITVPVNGEAKKVEFFFDPNLDDVREVARELVEEFQLRGVNVDYLAKEIEKQINEQSRKIVEERQYSRIRREQDEKEELEEHFMLHAKIQKEKEKLSSEVQTSNRNSKSGRFGAPYAIPNVVTNPHAVGLLPSAQLSTNYAYQYDAPLTGTFATYNPNGPPVDVQMNMVGVPVNPSVTSSSDSNRRGTSSGYLPKSLGRSIMANSFVDETTEKENPSSNNSSNLLFDRKSFKTNMALMSHCANGKYDMVKQKLENGAMADFADYDKRTPLHLASTEGHHEIVKLLIEHGADVEAEDRWGSKPMDEAQEKGHEAVMEELVKGGAHREKRCMSRKEVLSRQLMQYSANGFLDLVKEMLMAGAPANFVDSEKRSPLHLACAEGQFEVAKLLLLNGADAMQRDKNGSTPMDEAIKSKHLDMLELLRSFGGVLPAHLASTEEADKQNGLDLVHLASRGHLNRVACLLGRGMDVNFANYDSRTALHLACAEGHLEVVKCLIEAGADITVKDRWGVTPLQEASQYGHCDVMETLMQLQTGSDEVVAENNEQSTADKVSGRSSDMETQSVTQECGKAEGTEDVPIYNI